MQVTAAAPALEKQEAGVRRVLGPGRCARYLTFAWRVGLSGCSSEGATTYFPSLWDLYHGGPLTGMRM